MLLLPSLSACIDADALQALKAVSLSLPACILALGASLSPSFFCIVHQLWVLFYII